MVPMGYDHAYGAPTPQSYPLSLALTSQPQYQYAASSSRVPDNGRLRQGAQDRDDWLVPRVDHTAWDERDWLAGNGDNSHQGQH